MAMESQNEKLKEQAYLLLFGLLDEHDAEAFRLKVATDGNVARVFDDAREGVVLLRGVTSLVGLQSLVEAARGGGAPDESISSEATTRIEYDPAAEFFSDLNSATISQTQSQKKEAARDVDSMRRDRKRRRFRRVQRQTFLLGESDPPPTKRSVRLFFYTSVSAHIGKLWQKTRQISPVTILLTLLLTILTLATSLAIYTQKWQLKRFFSGDFRIQMAMPRNLVKTGSQSIEILTSDYLGSSKRVPVRFCFTDPQTRDFLLAHTESGNADGMIVYDLPDMSNFPSQTLLSVYAGSEELEVFQTILPVVEQTPGEVDKITNESLTRAQEVLVNQLIDRETARFQGNEISNIEQSGSPSEGDDHVAQTNIENEDSNANEPFETVVEIRPEIGRLASNFINRMRVFATLQNGKPVARQFVLEEVSTGTKLTFASDASGAGNFEWTPKKDSLYRLSVVANGEGGEDGELQESGAYPYEEKEKLLFEDDELSFSFKMKPERNDGALFTVQPSEEEIGVGLESLTVNAFEPVRLKVNAIQKTSLLAVVEKNGFVIKEHFITVVKGNNSIEIPLPTNLSGLFTLSFYQKKGASLLPWGGSIFYRLCESDALGFDVAVKYHGDDTSAQTELQGDKALAITASKSSFDRTRLHSSSGNELPMTLSIFWTPDVESAICSLDAEELFSAIDVENVKGALLIPHYQATAPPPLIFDNLITLAEHNRGKMEVFQERQARTSRGILRLGYLGCYSIIIISLFLVLFSYFSVWRGTFFVLLSVVVALFFMTFQKSVTSFFRVTEDIVVSTGSETSKTATDYPSRRFEGLPEQETNLVRQTTNPLRQVSEVRALLSRKIGLGTTTIPYDELFAGKECDEGYLLVKLVDGSARRWVITKTNDMNSQEER